MGLYNHYIQRSQFKQNFYSFIIMNILINLASRVFFIGCFTWFYISMYLFTYVIDIMRYFGMPKQKTECMLASCCSFITNKLLIINPFIRMTIQDNVNLNKIANTRPMVLIMNHRSIVDGLITPGVMPYKFMQNMRVFVKSSVVNIPILGRFFEYCAHFKVHLTKDVCGSFSVDPVKQAQVADEIDQFLNANGSISLFPEGQYVRDPSIALQTFRRGSFKLIIKHRLPIVYGVMVGADDLWPAQARIGGYPCCISIEYNMLEVDYEGRDKDITAEELSERMHNIMKNKYMDMVEARNKKCNA